MVWLCMIVLQKPDATNCDHEVLRSWKGKILSGQWPSERRPPALLCRPEACPGRARGGANQYGSWKPVQVVFLHAMRKAVQKQRRVPRKVHAPAGEFPWCEAFFPWLRCFRIQETECPDGPVGLPGSGFNRQGTFHGKYSPSGYCVTKGWTHRHPWQFAEPRSAASNAWHILEAWL